jgi:flagellar hook-associated protein 2
MTGIDGIISGLDTSAIISGVLSALRRPIRTMELQKGGLEAKRTAYRELNTLLGNLATTLAELDTTGEFGSFTTASTQADAITATAGEGAIAGSYAVSVTALAEGSLDVSNGFSATTDVIANGSLDITVGGTLSSITINAAALNNTPASLAQYINDNVDGAFAYVVDTGTPGPNQFKDRKSVV